MKKQSFIGLAKMNMIKQFEFYDPIERPDAAHSLTVTHTQPNTWHAWHTWILEQTLSKNNQNWTIVLEQVHLPAWITKEHTPRRWSEIVCILYFAINWAVVCLRCCFNFFRCWFALHGPFSLHPDENANVQGCDRCYCTYTSTRMELVTATHNNNNNNNSNTTSA